MERDQSKEGKERGWEEMTDKIAKLKRKGEGKVREGSLDIHT